MTRKTKNRKAIQENLDDSLPKDLMNNVVEHRVHLKFKNQKQKEFAKLIEDNEIIICSGPAGTGKSYVSIGTALELLQKPENKYDKIVIIKPIVESSDYQLGYLKGSLKEKLEPYAASSLSIIDKIIGVKSRKKLEEENIILIDTMSFLRGKSFDGSLLIMEESQNLSPNEMKTLLTRIGENSKFIISGDIDQSDRYKNVKESGLYDAINRFKNLNKIKLFTFGVEDVVRNPIITSILKLYDTPKKEEEVKIVIKPQLLTEEKVIPEPKVIKTESNFLNKIKKYIKW
jgi:phosphate starvation-inducible PhoH-like protein